jgi:hypothetical protein
VDAAGNDIRAELGARAGEGATYLELIQYLDGQSRRFRDRPLSEYYELSRYCWTLTRSRANRIRLGENGARHYQQLER